MAGRWIKRFETYTKSNLVLVALLLVSTLVSAVLVIGNASIGVSEWAKETLDWRDQEYELLTELHAGYTRAKFESVLGEPVFDRQSPDGRYREQTFRRREYWVQTIGDQDGTVQLYAITACGPSFRPAFNLPGATSTGEQARVELNVSKLDSVIPGSDDVALEYFGSGATANSRFHEILGSSNPSNYKTFVWGINDVCFDWFSHVYPGLIETSSAPATLVFSGRSRQAPAWVHRLRATATVNTYAETAPLFDIRKIPKEFQIGADRILTRTTED